MAFVVFRKTGNQINGAGIVFIPAQGRIGLNSAACHIFRNEKVEAVLLLWDPDRQSIALKATQKGDAEAYTVAFHKNGHSATLSGAAFFRWIGWTGKNRTTAPAKWKSRERRLEAVFKKQSPQTKRKRLRTRRGSETHEMS
jgi:hypothetical protein